MGVTGISRRDGAERGYHGPAGPGDEQPRASAPSRDELNQRLRVRRFLLASVFSLLYLVVLGIYYAYDDIDRVTLAEAAAFVLAEIAVLFIVFRRGFNRRFPDPSLTALQIVAAVSTMLFVVYRAPETRSVFAAFFFVALMFGMLRGRARELTLLGFVSLAAFGLLSWMRYVGNHDMETLRLDLLQLVVTAIAFPWLIFIGTQVKRLKEADRRKDDFLATLAHELRNPLAPIRTGIQILGITGGGKDAPTVLPMMERQLRHLTRLLDDLLDVSRITRGKISLHLERTDVREAVIAAIETSRPLIEQMGHALELSLPDEPLMVDADPVRVTQVISNLLNNAARYTPRGGSVTLHVARLADDAEITVRDNGIGIPQERLQSIFAMFEQLHAPDSPSTGGLGIGLALVKGLVVLHGGTIEARSGGPGRGSEFCVRLPLRALHAARAVAREAEHPRVLRKVLVVDDNRDAASSLVTLLELMGHDVRVAFDGAQGLDIAAEFHPDIALLDLGMPGMDGLQVCRRMREVPWGRDMRIVAVTGWGQDEDRRQSAAAGFNLHLVKPVTPQTLSRAIAGLQCA